MNVFISRPQLPSGAMASGHRVYEEKRRFAPVQFALVRRAFHLAVINSALLLVSLVVSYCIFVL